MELLTTAQLSAKTGIPAGTIRQAERTGLIAPAKVEKRGDDYRTCYWNPDDPAIKIMEQRRMMKQIPAIERRRARARAYRRKQYAAIKAARKAANV